MLSFFGHTSLLVSDIRWQVQHYANFPLVAGFLASFAANLPFKSEMEASTSPISILHLQDNLIMRWLNTSSATNKLFKL